VRNSLRSTRGVTDVIMVAWVAICFTRFNRGQFGQETDAVSVRKAKNIASEVDRKRTNKITLFFASSMGLPPSPAQ